MSDQTATLPPEADTCLSFTVSGDWAHFRRVEGNIVKQTYKIPPRTTVAGMIAGILGFDRDDYYKLFQPDNSAIAVEPLSRLRTMNMPMNTLSTDDSNMTSVGSRYSIKVGLVTADDPSPRQQHNYEVVVDPAYRVDIWLGDGVAYTKLREFLASGKSVYPPSLGLSEHLANIEYHGEFDIEVNDPNGTRPVVSSVPNAPEAIVPTAETRTAFEKSPGFMEATDSGRRTTRFVEHGYTPSAEPLQVTGIQTQTVDGREVIFT